MTILSSLDGHDVRWRGVELNPGSRVTELLAAAGLADYDVHGVRVAFSTLVRDGRELPTDVALLSVDTFAGGDLLALNFGIRVDLRNGMQGLAIDTVSGAEQDLLPPTGLMVAAILRRTFAVGVPFDAPTSLGMTPTGPTQAPDGDAPRRSR